MSARSLAVRWSVPFVGAVAILLSLLAPISLGPTEIARALENAFHAPLFALVAIGLLLWLRHLNRPASLHQQYASALLLAVALGAAGEIAQSFTTARHAEWIDVVNDIVGAAAGLSLYALYDKRRRLRTRTRRALWLVIVAAVIVVGTPIIRLSIVYWQRWQQLPELVTWGMPAGYHFVIPGGADLSVVYLEQWNIGDAEVALQVSPLRESRWVGMTIEEPWPDWTGYSQLAIEVVNPNDLPLELYLRINDRSHNNDFDDRFNRRFVIGPRKRTLLTVPLSEVRAAPASRLLDMEKISRLVLFQDAQRGELVLYVCGIRLVR